MTKFDLIVFGIIVFSSIVGLVRGFVREILSLSSWTLSVIITYYSYQYLESILLKKIDNSILALYGSIFITFVVMLFVFSTISYYLSSWIQGGMLGSIDKTLGAVFGAARGITLLLTCELISSNFVSRDAYPALVKEGNTLKYIQQGSSVIEAFLPKKIKNYLNSKTQEEKTNEKANKKAFDGKISEKVNEVAKIEEKNKIEKQSVVKHKDNEELVKRLSSLNPKQYNDSDKIHYSVKQKKELNRVLDSIN